MSIFSRFSAITVFFRLFAKNVHFLPQKWVKNPIYTKTGVVKGAEPPEVERFFENIDNFLTRRGVP